MQRVLRRTLVAVALCLCVFGVVGHATAVQPGSADTPTAPSQGSTVTVPPGNGTAGSATGIRAGVPDGQFDSHDSIVLTQEFRLTPDSPGEIDVEWQYRIPDRVSDVRTRLPPDATDVRTERFTRRDGIYVWSGEATTASITFTLGVNTTTRQTGPEATAGQLKFADTGEWALTRRPRVATPGYTHPRGRDPGVTIRNTTAGEGVAGEALLYLGPHETFERSAHGQRFRLVVPRAATLAEDREQILESVAGASDRLRVGDRDERVLMIAAPTSVQWGVRGLQIGDRDLYVGADERLDTADNTWLHEYVHTRQDFEDTDATEWVFEGAAEYYAAQLTLEQDRIAYQSFREVLERGTWQRFSSVRLVEPTTWRTVNGNYYKGALVVGELDRQIRAASGGSATLHEVFRRMNREDSPVTQSEFVDSVRAVGGQDVADAARRFTETTDTPRTWSSSTHQDAFGALPARFGYDVPDPGTEGVRVRSPYREGPLGDAGLVAGETLVLDVTVENVGGATGEYDLGVTVDGTPVANRTGRLAAGATATETVEHTFDRPGRYTVAAGEDSRTVRVREPATPVVMALSADRATVGPGEAVRLVATVENPADRPAERTVTIGRDGTTVASQQVGLAPGGSTEVTATVTLSETGTHRFEAGNRSVSVTVASTETPTPAETPTPSRTASAGDTEDNTGASGPGFGAVAALVALLLSALAGQRLE